MQTHAATAVRSSVANELPSARHAALILSLWWYKGEQYPFQQCAALLQLCILRHLKKFATLLRTHVAA